MISKEELKQIYPDISEDILSLNCEALPLKSDRVKANGDKLPIPTKNNDEKRQITININYPGSVITENHYLGRNGRHSYVKPEARAWQKEFIEKLEQTAIKRFTSPIKVTLTGVFKNNRCVPDMHNMKILMDSIQQVTGINDREYFTETIPGTIDKKQVPHLIIKISEVN